MKIKSVLVLLFIACASFASYTSIEAMTSNNSVSVSRTESRYIRIAKSVVDSYISRLESEGYTDQRIVSSLQSRKLVYLSKKSSKMYQGRYKYQIDAIINTLEEAIREYQSNSIMYDDFYSSDPYVSSSVCTQEARMCSDGSYVSRSGPRCEFSTCPTVSNVSKDYITAVINSMSSNNIYSRFTTPSNSYYKEYDVYIFTPTINGQSYGKTQATNFIYGPEKLIYNTYNSYTITTQFQATYDTQKVAIIRSQVPTSGYTYKKNINISSQSNEHFGIRGSEEFDRNAIKTFKDIYYYETYFLYIAKDNSEAFTLRYAQSGKKSGYSSNDMQIDGARVMWPSYNTTLTYKNTLYSNYKLMYYTPSRYSDAFRVTSQLGIGTVSTLVNYDHSISSGQNGSIVLSIKGYKVDPNYIASIKPYFVGGMDINPTTPANPYNLYYGVLSDPDFNQRKMSDGIARTYLLLVSPDDRQAYLTEFTQYAPSLQ